MGTSYDHDPPDSMEFVIWLLALNIFGLTLGVLLVLETFRQEPMWWRPEKALSPRQRRWYGAGMVIFLAPQTVTGLGLPGETELFLLRTMLMVLAIVAMVAAYVKGPTEGELERRDGLVAS